MKNPSRLVGHSMWLLLALLTACGGSGAPAPPPPPPQPPPPVNWDAVIWDQSNWQ
ncbi:MAG TPA: hypothetical protein VFO82_07930 [Steroidobacteraceae bacterium]|nr:hypothetical protein [Steroidobacteraceae bacterium]